MTKYLKFDPVFLMNIEQNLKFYRSTADLQD